MKFTDYISSTDFLRLIFFRILNYYLFKFKLFYEKNNFAGVSRNLNLIDADLKIILLDYQNNYVENLNMMLQKVLTLYQLV